MRTFKILIVLITLNACSDITGPEVHERAISDDVIATTMRAYLNTQESANLAIVSNPELLLNNVDLTTIQNLCNEVIDTSFVIDFTKDDFNVDFSSNIALILECNDLGFPTQISFEETSTGEYSSLGLQSTFNQISSYQIGIDLIDMTVLASGITGHTGALLLDQEEGYEDYSVSLRLDLAEMSLDILSQDILGGSAIATINYSNDEVEEQYIVKINYLGNSSIKMEVNGTVYELDFGN